MIESELWRKYAFLKRNVKKRPISINVGTKWVISKIIFFKTLSQKMSLWRVISNIIFIESDLKRTSFFWKCWAKKGLSKNYLQRRTFSQNVDIWQFISKIRFIKKRSQKIIFSRNVYTYVASYEQNNVCQKLIKKIIFFLETVSYEQ